MLTYKKKLYIAILSILDWLAFVAAMEYAFYKPFREWLSSGWQLWVYVFLLGSYIAFVIYKWFKAFKNTLKRVADGDD